MSKFSNLLGVLKDTLRRGDALTLEAARHRRLERQVTAAADALVIVGDVLIPFKYLVASGLTARGVATTRITGDTLECIRAAIRATISSPPRPQVEEQSPMAGEK